MPKTAAKRKYRRNVPKKKTYKKRGNKRAVLTRIPGTILPDKLQVKLPYTERYDILTAAGSAAYQRMSGNSAYDPDYTGAGQQPLGFDEWKAFYTKYVVKGSKCDVQIVPVGSNYSYESVLVPFPGTSASASSNLDNLKAMQYAKWGVSQTSGNLRRMSTYMDTTKLYGKPNITDEIDPAFSALIGSDPAEEWTWQIGVQPCDRASTVYCVVYVKMTYYITFFDRTPLLQ